MASRVGGRNQHELPGLVAGLIVAAALAVFFATERRIALGGDEPHYLIIADSLITDRDVNLENNYERDARTSAIYGSITPHVYRIPDGWAIPMGWWPYHGIGLPVLIAAPFAIAGQRGARMALCLFSGLMPLALAWWLAALAGEYIAAWTVIGAAISMPVLFGSTQIYPDLPGGVMAVGLTCWLLSRERDPDGVRGWPLFWLTIGFLPWLHIKFAGTTLVFAAGGAGMVLWLRRTGREQAARFAAATMPLAATGVGLLAWWHWSHSGSVLGFRQAHAELTDSPARALMIFLGLHLDQSQGMFFAQPLLLAGVASLVPFMRSKPWTAAFWAALYVSLIVPNAMELARYGLGGPAGRFAWSAMWLWLVPFGYAAVAFGPRVRAWVKPAAIGGILYQILLAIRWVPAPDLLWTSVDDPRNTIFPGWLSRHLPSFYTWDFTSYLRSPTNHAAFLCVLLLVIVGGVCSPDDVPTATGR